MKFVSTRDAKLKVSIRDAIKNGLAPDGGLYVPEAFPKFSSLDFKNAKTMADVAAILLAPFFTEDESLSKALPAICDRTFQFPIPLTSVPGKPGDFILELFHGPTSAFKDVGARFLANTMETIIHDESIHAKKVSSERNLKKTVVVATSGDTGGAVAGAFFEKPNLEVCILYPDKMISARQEKQLCAWGSNIHAFAVKGTFDDCQRMVKETLQEAFNSQAGSTRTSNREWLSANSINLGRILPQMVYYAHATLQLQSASFVIPSGNLGNSMAAVWVKKMGLPVNKIFLGLNANQGVADFLKTGTFPIHPTIATLANAMDVSKPSNLERLKNLYPVMNDLREFIQAESVNDEAIRDAIKTSESDWGQVFCPHTAVAGVIRKHQLKSVPSNAKDPWVIVATAHPAKFESIVEPLIGHEVPIPEALAKILLRPSQVTKIDPTYSAFVQALDSLDPL